MQKEIRDLCPGRRIVLHIIDSGGVYGIEKMIISLLPKLKGNNYEAGLISLRPLSDPKNDISIRLKNNEISVFKPHFLDKIGLRTILYLYKIFHQYKPAIIHLHGYKATILGGGVAFLMRIPTIATCHAETKYMPELAKYVKIETFVLKRVKRAIAVSDSIAKELKRRQLKESRIEVIFNGIDDYYNVAQAENKGRYNTSSPLLLFAGRLAKKKNIHILINAVSRLKTEFPGIKLLVAGDGPYKNKLEEQIMKLNLMSNVELLGYVDDIHSLYIKCDCFVLPSQTEGMPIALLEAMASSTPIVVTSVGSVPKVVTHMLDALVIPPNNEDSLYKALRHLLGDPLLLKRIGCNARKKFLQKYTSGIMTDKYISVYKNIVSSG